MNTPNDIADYIVRTLAAAGESITLRRLQNLLFQIQGYSLSLLGRPAFAEAITVTPAGPHIHTVGVAYAHCQGGPISPNQVHQPKWQDLDVYGTRTGENPGPAQLEGAVVNLIRAVLRNYDNAFTLHQEITTSPLWAHSHTTEHRVEQANMAAYFRKLPPLAMAVAALPTVNPWPVVHEEVDTAALHREALRQHMAEQEAMETAYLERTLPAASKPGLLARLGLGKGGE